MVVIDRPSPSPPVSRQDGAEPAVTAMDGIPRAAARHGRGTPRRVFAVVLVGSMVLGLFASRDLPSWADRLGDDAISRTARAVAIRWNDDLTKIDLTRPHQALRRSVQWLLDRSWSARDD